MAVLKAKMIHKCSCCGAKIDVDEWYECVFISISTGENMLFDLCGKCATEGGEVTWTHDGVPIKGRIIK